MRYRNTSNEEIPSTHLDEGELHHPSSSGEHAHPTVHEKRRTQPGLLAYLAKQNFEGIQGSSRR